MENNIITELFLFHIYMFLPGWEENGHYKTFIIWLKPLDKKKILLIKLKAIFGPYDETKWLFVQLNKGHVTTETTLFVYLQLKRKMQSNCLRNAPLSPLIFCSQTLANLGAVTICFYLSVFWDSNGFETAKIESNKSWSSWLIHELITHFCRILGWEGAGREWVSCM